MELHPSITNLLKFFEYEHLPERLQSTSEPFHMLAWKMISELPAEAFRKNGAEITTGLRKLLEAKDCFVRSAV